MPYAVRGSGVTLARPVRLIGSPGAVSTGDTFRLTFADVEINTVCSPITNPFSGVSAIVTGSIDGTYDVTGDGTISGCVFDMSFPSAGIAWDYFNSAGCGGAPDFSGNGFDLTFRFEAGHISIAVGNNLDGAGGRDCAFFRKLILPYCDFIEGVAIANTVTAFDPINFGKNGTLTIARVCP